MQDVKLRVALFRGRPSDPKTVITVFRAALYFPAYSEPSEHFGAKHTHRMVAFSPEQ